MPRYFFHRRDGERMLWDKAGLKLPNLKKTPKAALIAAKWSSTLDERSVLGQVLVVTNALGQVVFVTTK